MHVVLWNNGSVCGSPLLREYTSKADMPCTVKKDCETNLVVPPNDWRRISANLMIHECVAMQPCDLWKAEGELLSVFDHMRFVVRVCACMRGRWRSFIKQDPPSGLLFTLPLTTQGDDSSLAHTTWYKHAALPQHNTHLHTHFNKTEAEASVLTDPRLHSDHTCAYTYTHTVYADFHAHTNANNEIIIQSWRVWYLKALQPDVVTLKVNCHTQAAVTMYRPLHFKTLPSLQTQSHKVITVYWLWGPNKYVGKYCMMR